MSNIELDIVNRHRYAIRVGQELKDVFVDYCSENYSPDKIILVIDEHVQQLHQDHIERWCNPVFENIEYISVPQGESTKSTEHWKNVVDRILQSGVERGTPLMAVGGGVTGDLGGFAASTALRGIPLLHIPTTLLAMVDSSIGGKTGVNHSTGKNLIGAFYQPDAVFADTEFLQTLEDEQWINGTAEVLKYAAISDPDLFEELEKLVQKPFNANERWTSVIEQSMKIKARIVQEDALESGVRAYLNFGHTFAHALEKVADYGTISHGEAVFVGSIACAYLSQELGHAVDPNAFDPFIKRYRAQMAPLPSDVDALMEAMKTDKKVKNNMLRLVLLNGWGSPYIYESPDPLKLKEAWEFSLSKFK